MCICHQYNHSISHKCGHTCNKCVYIYVEGLHLCRAIQSNMCTSTLMIWFDIWYDMIWYDMIYLLTAVGLTSSGSSTVHIYTQYIGQHN
jgi:hypothetical protein